MEEAIQLERPARGGAQARRARTASRRRPRLRDRGAERRRRRLALDPPFDVFTGSGQPREHVTDEEYAAAPAIEPLR